MRIREGERVLVMGLAKSGEAVARLLKRHGMRVTVNDSRNRLEDDREADLMESLGIEVVLGGHPVHLLNPPPAFIVKNPGIPYSRPLIVEAIAQNIPIYTEIEVAAWLTASPIYAITGSNGKTTTTTLVGEILQEAQMRPMVAGNIGRVLSGVVEEVEADSPIVLEVSSFQLLGTEHFHPRIAALLNIYPSHLDYHGAFEDYVDAKMRLFQNMTAEDIAVLNFDSEVVRNHTESLQVKKVWFSRLAEVEHGACLQDEWVVFRDGATVERIVDIGSLLLKGDHQLENVLAATAITRCAGASVEAIQTVLTRFQGVEHRLEFVRRIHGVDYFNDSKATNAQAALHALQSIGPNIVWIAGGLDRGDDFKSLETAVRVHVKHAILLGQSAAKLGSLCERTGVSYEQVDSLEQAVLHAHQATTGDEVVLLSPACASWDMFSSFEERGRMFKESVHRL